jgi:conjugal transfer pilus assembly protein TraF
MIARVILIAGFTLTAAWSAAGATSVSVDDGRQPVRFHERHAEGWFWYQDPPLPEEPPITDTDEPPPALSPRAHLTPDAPLPAPSASTAGPPPLSTPWLRDNLQRYLDIALDDPTPDKVELWYRLQKVALNRSTRFARMATRVVAGNPYLDESLRRPLASAHAREQSGRARARKDALLEQLAGATRLFFFYDADCALCPTHGKALGILARLHGFAIMPISRDGSPPPEPFSQALHDGGLARALGVVSTPATFIHRPPDPAETHPIGQSALSVQELEQRILNRAQDAGWISRRAWAQAQPVRVDWMFTVDPARIPPDAADDPARLLQALRGALVMPMEDVR